MMYKTPTFAEHQQCNRPFSTGQLSAFIIQLVTWQVLVREIQRLSTRSATLHSWKDVIFYTRGRNPRSSIGTRVITYYSHKRGICLVQWYLLRQIPRYTEFPRTNTPPMGKSGEKKLRIGKKYPFYQPIRRQYSYIRWNLISWLRLRILLTFIYTEHTSRQTGIELITPK
jgi:hypothetical protein